MVSDGETWRGVTGTKGLPDLNLVVFCYLTSVQAMDWWLIRVNEEAGSERLVLTFGRGHTITQLRLQGKVFFRMLERRL